MSEQHKAKAVKMSHAWVAECSTCRWMGPDHRTEARAAKDAAEHERDPSKPEMVPWTPSRMPFTGV